MATASVGVAAVLSPLCGRDYLSSADCSAEGTAALLDLAAQLKSGDRRIDLGNRVLGLIFSKASTRTRVSFQVAMARLGGQTVDLNPSVTQLGRGEPCSESPPLNQTQQRSLRIAMLFSVFCRTQAVADRPPSDIPSTAR